MGCIFVGCSSESSSQVELISETIEVAEIEVIDGIGVSDAAEVLDEIEIADIGEVVAIIETEDEAINDYEIKANLVTSTEDTVTFIDALGIEKTLSKNPERVVSLYTSHTGLWYEAGGQIVGRIQTATSDIQLPEEALDVEIVATSSSAANISVEMVIAAEPDLVILGTAMSQPTLVEPLEAAGIATIVVDYEDIRDYLKWFKVFSLLNDSEELYENIAKQTLSDTLTVMEAIPSNAEVTVLNLYGAASTITANLSSSTVGGMIAEMGAINIADSWADSEEVSRLDLSLEAVVAANPSKILVQQYTDSGSVQTMVEDMFAENIIWQTIDAVINEEVYYLDIELFHYKPNSRFNEAYEVLFEILYED